MVTARPLANPSGCRKNHYARGVRLGPKDREVGQIREDDHVPELALPQAFETQAAITHDGRRARRLEAALLAPAHCGAGAREAH